MQKNEDGNLEKSFYVAVSFVIDNSETIMKTYEVLFTGFRASQAIDDQVYNFKAQGKPSVNCVMSMNEYGNRTIVDVQFDENHLWILTEELAHFSKSGLGMQRLIDGDNNLFPYRTTIQKFRIRRNLIEEPKELKWLKDAVWTQDDELVLERVENNEFIDPSVITNKHIEGRIFRRLGGEYIKNKDLCKVKHYTSKPSLAK